MMQRKSVLAAAAATLALTLGASAAAQTPPIIGYWLDSSGRIVRNTWGECWRTGSWTPALAIPECEGGAKAAAAPTAAVGQKRCHRAPPSKKALRGPAPQKTICFRFLPFSKFQFYFIFCAFCMF